MDGMLVQYPLIHLGGERHCESKVSSPKTQHNVLRPGFKPGAIRGQDANHEATTPPPYCQ